MSSVTKKFRRKFFIKTALFDGSVHCIQKMKMMMMMMMMMKMMVIRNEKNLKKSGERDGKWKDDLRHASLSNTEKIATVKANKKMSEKGETEKKYCVVLDLPISKSIQTTIDDTSHTIEISSISKRIQIS
jgi:hypothetical protein